MKFFAFFLFAFYLLFALACRPAAAPVSISDQPVSVNDVPTSRKTLTKPVGELKWTKFDGSDERLNDLRGKAVILDFWATYCKPCLEAIPHLKALQQKYGRENLEIIGLHVGGEEDRARVPEFVQKLKIDYPLAYPEDELTSFIFAGETAIPQTAVFDRQGKLVAKITGFDEKIKEQLDTAVEKAVGSGN